MTGTTDGLDRNWHDFQMLVARSERSLRQGRHERAAADAMTAATFAWCNHTGAFASGRLEDVLTSLAETLPVPDDPQPGRRADGAPRVLHVATQLYDTGGHTQILANWLRLARQHDQHVCVTAQGERPVPDKIASVLPAHDALTRLDRPYCGLMARAAALRELARHFDHVVLHMHPNDVVVPIGLGARVGEAPQVLLFNQADHPFWVGGRAADRVVNLRHSGARLNVSRRGIPPERNALLVRPLDLGPRQQSREQARGRLGIGSDAVLLVSAADRYKYVSTDGPDLLEIVLPVLKRLPGTGWHVAGPDADRPWSVLAEERLGRAWGVLPDVRTLLEAADVYLDSYPFSSLTSMLEAASLGVPVVTLQTGQPDSAVLGADTPELDDHLVVTRSPEELRAVLSDLLSDPAGRQRLGAATGAAVQRYHGRGAWAEQVEKVLDAPPVDALPIRPQDAPREVGELDQRLLQVMANGIGQGVAGTLDVVAPVLPWRRRLEAAVRLGRTGRPRPALLLPGGLALRIKRGRRSLLRPPARA